MGKIGANILLVVPSLALLRNKEITAITTTAYRCVHTPSLTDS